MGSPPRSGVVCGSICGTAPKHLHALTANHLRGRAPAYRGQTPRCTHPPGVFGLHRNQCREELSSTPLYAFGAHADSIGNNNGRNFPHDRSQIPALGGDHWQLI